MWTIRSFLRTRKLSTLLVGFAAIAIAAEPALAGRFDTGRDDSRRGYRHDDERRGRHYDDRDRYDHDRRHGGIDVRIGRYRPAPAPPPIEERVWVPPVYRTVVDRVWVEPVYRTVIDRVWIEPVVRTIPDRKWVPARHAWRDVVVHDRYGRRIVSREYVLVEPAHFIDCARDVIITPGRFEEHPRQELVCAGRWETVERQELVCEGHWQTHVLAPPPPPRGGSHARITLRLPF